MLKRHYEKWSSRESDELFRMADRGYTTAEIARKMHRSQNAVCHRIQIRRRLFEAMVESPATPTPMVNIVMAEVAEFYALGWRLSSFVNGAIVFKWPTLDPPLYPTRDLTWRQSRWQEFPEVA